MRQELCRCEVAHFFSKCAGISHPVFIGLRYCPTMAEYAFQLTEGDNITVLDGGARTDGEARAEAVQFLSEVLRDVAHSQGCDISVTVLKDGQVLCRANASMSACITTD